MKYEIIVENTAISNGVSNSTKMLIQQMSMTDVILDYGCGLLRNTKEIYKLNKNIDILDTKMQLNRIKEKGLNSYRLSYSIDDSLLCLSNKYDKILCSFVINVIPNKKTRIETLKNISMFLKETGIAYIEVRNDKFVKSLKHYEEDFVNGGIIIGNGKKRTYQCPFTKQSFFDLFISIDDLGLTIVDSIILNDSLIFILKK